MDETPRQAARRIVNATLLDTSRHHPDPEVRAWARALRNERLLAPWQRMGETVARVTAQIHAFYRAYQMSLLGVREQEQLRLDFHNVGTYRWRPVREGNWSSVPLALPGGDT